MKDSNMEIDSSIIEVMRERGGQWAVYQDRAFDSSSFGRLQFLKYGIECTYQEPPSSLPGDWKYQHVGFVDLTNGVVVTDSKEE